MQHGPDCGTTLRSTTMSVMPRRQRAVATCNSGGSPLQGLGTLHRPRLPIRTSLGRELLGHPVCLTLGLEGLESLEELGVASRTTGAGRLLLPIHQRQPQLCNPSPPPRREGHGLHSAPNPLPPNVSQGAQTSTRLAPLVHRLLCDGQSMRFASPFNLLGQIPRSLLRLSQRWYGRWHERLST